MVTYVPPRLEALGGVNEVMVGGAGGDVGYKVTEVAPARSPKRVARSVMFVTGCAPEVDHPWGDTEGSVTPPRLKVAAYTVWDAGLVIEVPPTV